MNSNTNRRTAVPAKNAVKPADIDAFHEEKDRIKELQNPNLLLNTAREIQKEGVVGEEGTILVTINKINMRLVKNKEPTSSNSVISDSSGAGKDYLPKKICKVVLPQYRYIHRTDITDKAFDYWQPLKPMNEWDTDDNGKKIPTKDSWDGYVLHLEDPREDAINSPSFKTMASGGTEATKVVEHKARDIKIEGKPVIIITSLKALVNNEGIRRFDTLRVDTSLKQTKQIISYKLRKATGKIDYKPNFILRDTIQTKLFPKNVVIPYAEELVNLLPDCLLMRTLTDKLLDCIKSSAVFHQYQREKQDNDTIIANGFDLAYGWFVFTSINSGIGIPTNPSEEELVRILTENGALSINEASNLYTRHSKQWIYDNKEKLVEKGLIRSFFEHNPDANKDIEYLTVGDNAILVFKGFKDVLKIAERIGFKGFKGFKELLYKINENRKKTGLNEVFHTFLAENLENHENLSIKPILKLSENHRKTNQLHDRLAELKEYFKSRKEQGKKITFKQLCFDFDKPFIEKCKEQKIVKSGSDGGFVWV